MADGKNIEIRIAATGGDQAAAEIKKVEEAAQQAAESSAKPAGMGGMLDNSPARDEAHEKRMTQIADEVAATQTLEAEEAKALEAELAGMKEKEAATAAYAEKLAESKSKTDELGDSSEKSGGKLDQMLNIQRAQVAAAIAQSIGAVGNKIREASAQFAASDPEFSKSLKNTAENVDALSASINGAANGMALGAKFGPAGAAFGAALGALTAGGLSKATAAFNDMTAAQVASNNASMQAVQLQHDLAAAYLNYKAAVLTDEIKDSFAAEEEALKKLLEQLNIANAVLHAKDKADNAARDRADADAVRKGASPEDVKAQRAVDDAKKAKDLIDADLDVKAREVNERQAISREKNIQRDDLKRDGFNATPEQIKEAEKIATEAAIAFEKALSEYRLKAAVVPQEKRAIDEKSYGKVEALGEAKSKRLQAEEEKAQKEKEKDAREAQREKQKRLQGQMESEKEKLKGTATENKARIENSEAVTEGQKRGRGGPSVSPVAKDLKGLASDIGSADTTAEINAVKDAIKAKSGELSAAMVAALTAMVSKQEAQVKNINALHERIRRMEGK